MIDLNFATMLGLIGVTMVIAIGKVFDPMREWLKGFSNPMNPLRWLGDGMSCTMCSGWWVGFWWGLYSSHSFGSSVLIGGVASVLSYATDEALAIVAAFSIRMVRRAVPPPAPMPGPTIRAPRVPDSEKPLTEEQADMILDDENENADRSRP